MPRTLLIFPAVVSLYVEISQRRKPLHNVVAIPPRSDAGALSSIDHPAAAGRREQLEHRGMIRVSSGTARLISSSRFAKWPRSHHRRLIKLASNLVHARYSLSCWDDKAGGDLEIETKRERERFRALGKKIPLKRAKKRMKIMNNIVNKSRKIYCTEVSSAHWHWRSFG